MPRQDLTVTATPALTALAIVAVDITQTAERLKLNILDVRVDGIYRLIRVHVFGGHAEGDTLVDALVAAGATLDHTETVTTVSGWQRAVDLTHTGCRVIVDTTVAKAQARA